MHAARRCGGIVVPVVQAGLFLLGIHPQQGFQQDQDQDDAQHAQRIGNGIGGCQRGGVQGCDFRRGALGLQDVAHCLLGGAQSGRVGDGAGHDTYHRPKFLAGNPVDGERGQDREQDHSEGEQIELDAAGQERMEESGTHLQSDAEDEQDQTEVLHEGKDGRVDTKAEMAGQDAQEQDPGRTDGDPLDLETPQPEAGCDHEGEQQDAVGDTGTGEQILHRRALSLIK